MQNLKIRNKHLFESPRLYVEWKVESLLSICREEDSYIIDSTRFCYEGANWYLQIQTNFNDFALSTGNESSKLIGLFLFKEETASKYRVFLRLGIKRNNGLELRCLECCNLFEKEVDSCGIDQIEELGISDLIIRNATARDGSVTVFCSVKLLQIVDIKFLSFSDAGTKFHKEWTSLTVKTALKTQTTATASQTSSPAESTEEALLQSDGITTLDDFKNTYGSVHRDVTFIFKEIIFTAHKSVLGALSPVFASMFKSELAERSNEEVEISDCDPETFEQFLQFLYTGKVHDLECSKIMNLYQASYKFGVQELKEECVRCMVRDMSVNTFCDVILQEPMYHDSDLLTAAINFFFDNRDDIMPTIKWQALSTEKPLFCKGLYMESQERERMNNVWNEVEVFARCMG